MQIANINPITMTSREIAELTGKEHYHVMRDLKNLQEQLGESFVGSIQVWIHPQNKQKYEEFVLDKDTTLCLLTGYDAVARMKVIKRWQVLEEAVKLRAPSEIVDHIAALEVVGRMLNMSEAGKLGMVSRYAKVNAPYLLPALPVYAVDAPLIAGSSPTSSEVAFSATDLLKKFNVGISTKKFNILAEKAGIIESKTRSSTKYSGVGRTYWSIKDLYYGKNITYKENEKETQPYWYECKFEELLSKIQ